MQDLEKNERARRYKAAVMTTAAAEASRDAIAWQILLFSPSKQIDSPRKTILSDDLAPRQRGLPTAQRQREGESAGIHTVASQNIPGQGYLALDDASLDMTSSEANLQPDFLSMTDIFGASPARAFDEWWSHGPL